MRNKSIFLLTSFIYWNLSNAKKHESFVTPIAPSAIAPTPPGSAPQEYTGLVDSGLVGVLPQEISPEAPVSLENNPDVPELFDGGSEPEETAVPPDPNALDEDALPESNDPDDDEDGDNDSENEDSPNNDNDGDGPEEEESQGADDQGDDESLPDENDNEPGDSDTDVTDAPVEENPQAGGEQGDDENSPGDNDNESGDNDTDVTDAPVEENNSEGDDENLPGDVDESGNTDVTDAPVEGTSQGDDEQGGDDDNESGDSNKDVTDAPVEGTSQGDDEQGGDDDNESGDSNKDVTDAPVEEYSQGGDGNSPDDNDNESGDSDTGVVEAPMESYSSPPDDDGKDNDGLVGSSYCTYAPDYDCYVSGWPTCCDDDDNVECPLERPLCEGEEGWDNVGDEGDNNDGWSDWEDNFNPPSASPVKYISRDDDILENEKEMEYDGVNYETLEEMAHDKNVLIALSTVFGLMILFSVLVAHQMLNNPDGCCASFCRVVTQCTCCIFGTVCFPCRMVCGGNKRRGHTRMMNDSNTYGHDLELT
eukprot:CAMPEP_0194260524 /NCGR_PEP_ID=MMETSP0158-20130606/45556_1 /TAXON_ID=33649 /ORGANISM="Thalassionema nitzschioides, Strain L26-B" /LENGTH=533 /DNA_ID=CAMNT_0039000617 /DNA_START=16 /DNA_END=1617 /DNA_ORIENTATION=+